jgi:phosphohistidine phosphatase
MKLLGLIRHAKSDWDNADLEDFERPLNPRGYRDARRMAERLKAAGFVPDYLLSSTAIRAASTALIFSRIYHLKESQIRFSPRLYASNENLFMGVLHSLPDTSSCSFVFGHNDTLTQVAGMLTRESAIQVPTCGVVLLEAPIDTWQELDIGKLVLFDFPKNEGLAGEG